MPRCKKRSPVITRQSLIPSEIKETPVKSTKTKPQSSKSQIVEEPKEKRISLDTEIKESPIKSTKTKRQSSKSQKVEEPKGKRISLDKLQHFKVYQNEIVEQIRNYLCDENQLPQSLFIYGVKGTGKTQIVSSLLCSIVNNLVIVNCNVCFTSKSLFEAIVNGMFDHKLSSKNNYTQHTKCDNARDFLDALATCDPFLKYVIMIDGAEKLMKMEDTLAMFLRLKEMCDLNICCVFVSTVDIDLLHSNDQRIVICWPQYSKQQILNVLLDKFDDHKTYIANHLAWTGKIEGSGAKNVEDVIGSMDLNFFENYLKLFLQVSFRYCRDLSELVQASQECFQKYCEPILNGICDMTDVQTLYRNISETLKTSMIKTYNSIDRDSNTITSVDRLITTKAQQLELPYFAKYILIAGFLASHNDAQSDKRLFMKNHGKQRKRLQDIKSKAVVSEKLTTQLGPKSFDLDRLFAIFYAIIDDKISINCNLMSQIPTLVRLNLLTYVSGENNMMDGNARLQCTVGLDFIVQIGKSVDFNVRQHLCDFF